MLKQLSRLERTRSVIIIAFASVMALSLLFFYAPNQNTANPAATTNREVLARVGDDKITVGDLNLLKENYQQMLGGQISLAQLGGDRRLLDGLIRDRIVAQEAARIGLSPSDAEWPKISANNSASPQVCRLDRYKEAVASRYGSVERSNNRCVIRSRPKNCEPLSPPARASQTKKCRKTTSAVIHVRTRLLAGRRRPAGEASHSIRRRTRSF